MTSISKKHKDKIIGGLITILLGALALFVKSLFTKPPMGNEKPIDTKNVYHSPNINNVNKDSGKQTINQLSQANSNKGDVNNEFVSGDKKTYNNYGQTNRNKQDTVLVNNGFLNQGGSGNTYNQTINPKTERELNYDYYKYLDKIDKGIAVYFKVYNLDAESIKLVNKMTSYLKKRDYKYVNGVMQDLDTAPIDKLGKTVFEWDTDSTNIFIIIYPLK